MDTDTLKVALAHAAEARKTEISLLWSRSLYFWGFIAVVIVAYGGALNVDQFTLAFLSTCIGFVLSLCWTLANRSSKYWQEVWEWKSDYFSEQLFQNKLFTTYPDVTIDLSGWWAPKRFSPSKLAMAVSDMIVVVWFVLGIAAVSQETSPSRVVVDMLLGVAALTYAANILRACRSGDAVSWKELWSEIRGLVHSWRKPLDTSADF
jgi:hypothetical protein